MRAAITSVLVTFLGAATLACGSDAASSNASDASTDASTGASSGAGSGGDASASDANGSAADAGASDAGAIAFEAGAPITATADTWTWVPFDDAHCGDGSATGIGVNVHPGATRLLIYLEGGGACWSELTCYTIKAAANFSAGYGESNFTSDVSGFGSGSGTFFDRAASVNPFKDASFVYVPYCTGDIHAGNNVATYGTHTGVHDGYRNVAAYLARLVPTFPGLSRVFLAGSSAGGFGALYNWGQVQGAFGAVRVDLIDDSGTFMPPDVLADAGSPFESETRSAWNLASTLPPGCTACTTRLDALYDYYAKAFPTNRGALLSYAQDSVLPSYFAISTAQFTTGLDEELTNAFVPNPNLRSFVVGKSGHVLLFNPGLTQGTTTVLQFLTSMTTDDPAWASVGP